MQSVPSEFVAHLRPLMFVAGLGPEQHKQQQQTSTSASAAAPTSATNGAASEPTLSAANVKDDPFDELAASLRQVFIARRNFRVYELDAGRGQRLDFHTVLVDKAVRFPPRKARAANNAIGPHSPISPFTPSSPLYPDGIMAPIWIRKHRELVPAVFVLVLRLGDTAGEPGKRSTNGTSASEPPPGEKHPSVTSSSPRDQDLINEIVMRKRTCAERGIKLAVVLLVSRQLLDDPSLDARLSHIRRTGALDSRASLFVLSPVPSEELQSFVASLQSDVYESAVDFYKEHGRRLRRKRSRPASSHPLSSSIIPSSSPAMDTAAANGGPIKGLSSLALNVRYEYKAAVFAELRGEVEVALKHYEDCYIALYDLFKSPPPNASPALGSSSVPVATVLHPRTKRWAEARVLADCLSIKLMKAYLYLGSSHLVMAQHRGHLKLFTRLAWENWNMDKSSFEYWSWASKQHRLFAELLEAALRAGFKLPPSVPSSGPATTLASARATTSHTPEHLLQHPGYAYYEAAVCASQRRSCFVDTNADFEAHRAAEIVVGRETPNEPPALRHERSVPHSAQIIELFTLAYEHFKRHRGVRHTLHVASQIAGIHALDGNPSMSARFDERVARTYRREGWLNILEMVAARSGEQARKPRPISELSKGSESDENDAAKVDIRALLRASLELSALSSKKAGVRHRSPQRGVALQETLRFIASVPLDAALNSDLPIDSLECQMPAECGAVFWSTTASLDTPVPFQVHLTAPSLSTLPESCKVTQLRLAFSDQSQTILFHHDGDIEDSHLISIVEQSSPSSQSRPANLSFSKASKKSIVGTVKSGEPNQMSLISVTITLSVGAHKFHLLLRPSGETKPAQWLHREKRVDGTRAWRSVLFPATEDHTTCRFGPRNIRGALTVPARQTAYLNENYPIRLHFTNHDEHDVSLILDALLHPFSGNNDGVNLDRISMSDDISSTVEAKTSITRFNLADSVRPGETIVRHVHLACTGHAGPRNLDFSVLAKPLVSEDQLPHVAATELAAHAEIQVLHPFFCDFRSDFFKISPLHVTPATPSSIKARAGAGIFDLRPPDGTLNGWQSRMHLQIGVLGEISLEVCRLSLNLTNSGEHLKVPTVDEQVAVGDLPAVWEPECPYVLSYDLHLSKHFALDLPNPPGVLEVEWRRPAIIVGDASNLHRTTNLTLIPLPPFPSPRVPDESDDAAPLVEVTRPPLVRLHEPFQVEYRLFLPPWAPDAAINRPRIISFYMDTTSESFAFTGQRKRERMTVLPGLLRDQAEGISLARYTLVAIGKSGRLDLPRFRVVEVLDTPAMEQQMRNELAEDEEYTGPRMRDLAIIEPDTICEDSDDSIPGASISSILVVPR